MKIKINILHLLICSMLLTSYSFAQNSSDYSSIPRSASSQEGESLSSVIAAQKLDVDLSATKNQSIKLKAGEELVINVSNPDNLYHSGEFENYDWKNDSDVEHALATSFYSDSWNPLNHTFSLEKENNLNQETGNPLLYHFKAQRSGKTYIYFHTTWLDKSSIYLKTLVPKPSWIGPKITVEVFQ